MIFGDYRDAHTSFKKSFERKQGRKYQGDPLATYTLLLKDAEKERRAEGRTAPTQFDIEKIEELGWWQCGRPYFNVWPTLLEPLRRFDLGKIQMGHLTNLQEPQCEIRLPKGAISGVESVLIHIQPAVLTDGTALDEMVIFLSIATDKTEFQNWQFHIPTWKFHRKDTTLSDWLDSKAIFADGDQAELIEAARIAIACMLMQNDPNAVEPDVFTEDRQKFEIADEDEKRRLIERAFKRRGRRGYHLGRLCETSPHWRSPHLALYWTGPGRSTPTIMMRQGCVVKRGIKDVPTGYRGSVVASA